MSANAERPETVGERVDDVMRNTPPKAGRNSRLGYISIEDFADLLGTTKQRVIDWRKGKGFPDPENRERLAAVSAGRYTADDFRRPTAPTRDQQTRRLEELEGEVDDLRGAASALLEIVLLLARQVEDLGGDIPAEVLDVAALAVLRTPRGAPER